MKRRCPDSILRTVPRSLAVPAALLALAAGGVTTASARTFVVYDEAAAIAALAAPGPDGRPVTAAAGWLQQQPGTVRVLPDEALAAKVSTGAGSAVTPSIRGMSAAQIAATLTEAIRGAGGHTVFVDELNTAYRGTAGEPLAVALAMMDHPTPWGDTYARRVHVYVPTLPELIAAPERWSAAWTALARAGGTWFQTYHGDLSPWTAAQWAAWPAAFRQRMEAAGGDPAHLHPVLSRGDQDAIWAAALTGPACELTRNGVGAFRLGGDVAAFRGRLVAAFGPDGKDTPACRTGTSDPAHVAGVAALAGWAATGTTATADAVAPARVATGRATVVRIRLGADPLGIAASLGLDPATLDDTGQPVVWAVSAGHVTSARLGSDGRAALTVRPGAAGPVRVELRVRAAGLGDSGGWFDRLSAAGAGPEQLGAAIRFPDTWRLRIPLLAPGGSPAITAVARLAPVSSVRLTAGPRRPGGRRVVAVTAIRRDGSPAAYTVLRVRSGRGVPYRITTDAWGTTRISSAAGRLEVRASGAAARLTVRR